MRHCPVCGAGVQRFHELSAEFTEPMQRHGWPYSLSDSETMNAAAYSCPHCAAVDRERMSALWILRAATTGGRLLHIGPREAIDRFLRERFDVRSADLEQDADDRADIQALPYDDESFDAFVCSHVLEHVPDDRAALRELRRILRPTGWGIVMVPVILPLDAVDEEPGGVSEAEAWRRFGQGDHLRLYNREGFLARVAEADFRASEHRFGIVDRYRYGIGRGSVLYTVTCAS